MVLELIRLWFLKTYPHIRMYIDICVYIYTYIRNYIYMFASRLRSVKENMLLCELVGNAWPDGSMFGAVSEVCCALICGRCCV